MLVRELVTRLGFETEDAERQVLRFTRLVGTLSETLLGVTVAAVAVSAGIFELAKKTAEYGVDVKKSAEDIGIATDAFQRLKYSADQFDLDPERFTFGLKFFTRIVGDAKLGLKGLGAAGAKELGHLGINIHQDQVKVLLDLADKLHTIKDTSERAAIAQQFFGRNSVRMANWLAQGSAALKAQGAEFEALGGIITEESTEQSEEFVKGMKSIGTAMLGVRNAIGVAFLPAFNDMIRRFKDWYVDNGKLIRQNIVGFFKTIGDVLGLIFIPVRHFTDAIVAMLRWVWEAPLAVKLLGAVLMAYLFPAFVASAIAAAPLVGAIASIVLALDDLVTYFEGGDSLLGNMLPPWNILKYGIQAFVEDITQAFANFENGIFNLAKSIGDFISNAGEKLLGWLEKVKTYSDVLGFIGQLLNPFGGMALGFQAAALPGGVANPRVQSIAKATYAAKHTNVTVNHETTITVPQGTSEDQMRAVDSQVKKSWHDLWNGEMRKTVGDVPRHGP
jgi:hypothetical protein